MIRLVIAMMTNPRRMEIQGCSPVSFVLFCFAG
jgi:hypothetical protein